MVLGLMTEHHEPIGPALERQRRERKKKERQDECELRDGLERYVAGRILKPEVAVGMEALAGTIRLAGAGFVRKGEHLDGV